MNHQVSLLITSHFQISLSLDDSISIAIDRENIVLRTSRLIELYQHLVGYHSHNVSATGKFKIRGFDYENVRRSSRENLMEEPEYSDKHVLSPSSAINSFNTKAEVPKESIKSVIKPIPPPKPKRIVEQTAAEVEAKYYTRVNRPLKRIESAEYMMMDEVMAMAEKVSADIPEAETDDVYTSMDGGIYQNYCPNSSDDINEDNEWNQFNDDHIYNDIDSLPRNTVIPTVGDQAAKSSDTQSSSSDGPLQDDFKKRIQQFDVLLSPMLQRDGARKSPRRESYPPNSRWST